MAHLLSTIGVNGTDILEAGSGDRRWRRGSGMFGLGDLESAVMAVLWESGEPVTVRETLERLDTPKKLAYTTVMTVMDNLHRKGWVRRELHGKAYYYEPLTSREEAAARALRE